MNVFEDLQGVERIETPKEKKKRSFFKKSLKFIAKSFIFYVNHKTLINNGFKLSFITLYFYLFYKLILHIQL